jgi:hypothetical protein
MKLKSLLVAMLCLSVSFSSQTFASLLDQPVGNRQAGPCDNPQTPDQLLACAGTFGKIATYTITTGAVANSALGEFAFDYSWIPAANVLVITYATPVSLWRVERSLCQLESGTWLMQADPRARGLTKSQTVDVYALPNCVSTPACLQQENPPPTCPQICEKLPPDEVIKYIAQVKVRAGVPLTFGIAGPNIWGKGGALQWQMQNGFTAKDGIEAVMLWK